MSEIWLTTGLPGSGKSTWAKKMVADHQEKYVRVNMDDIRATMGLGTTRESIEAVLRHSDEMEEIVKSIQDQMILVAVKAGKDVIIDNTHLNSNLPKRYKKLFDGDVIFRVKDFTDVPIAECIGRDICRNVGHVGEKVIRNMARQLDKPWRLTEDFMNDVKLSEPYVPRLDKPKAIIVDIDGTVARHDHRGPFDLHKVLTDGVYEHVSNVVRMYDRSGYVILFVSGRSNKDNVFNDTMEWLSWHHIPVDELFMRAENDFRNDADVKQEIFDMYIRNNYNVEAVYDDRNRVVNRWRKLGLPVFQVREGNF
jgi:predicted kinase